MEGDSAAETGSGAHGGSRIHLEGWGDGAVAHPWCFSCQNGPIHSSCRDRAARSACRLPAWWARAHGLSGHEDDSTVFVDRCGSGIVFWGRGLIQLMAEMPTLRRPRGCRRGRSDNWRFCEEDTSLWLPWLASGAGGPGYAI